MYASTDKLSNVIVPVLKSWSRRERKAIPVIASFVAVPHLSSGIAIVNVFASDVSAILTIFTVYVADAISRVTVAL